MTTVAAISTCHSCALLDQGSKTYENRNGTCRAFPQGVPDEIAQGKADHREPYPGDNGVQWVLDDERSLFLDMFVGQNA